MKNFYKITLALAVMLISSSSFAQDQKQATANLNVLLGNAYNIEINSLQKDVTISMEQASDFINGNSSQQTDHIQITSTGTYSVTVKADAANFVPQNGGATDIGVNNIYVVPQEGSLFVGNSNATDFGIKSVYLSGTNSQEILNVDAGERKRGFNIEYSIPATRTDNFLNKEADTYTTVVTYTLIP